MTMAGTTTTSNRGGVTSLTMRAVTFLCLVTSVQGTIQISQNTEWNTARNLTEVVVIQADQTLTIKGPSVDQPIVIDLHDTGNTGGGFKIGANAKLIVENAILTRWNEEFNIDAVSFSDDTTGQVKFHQVRCQHMGSCIALNNGNMVEVSDSVFRHNHKGVSGRNGQAEIIKTSLFVENEIGIAGSEWILEDCVLMRNNEASVGEKTKFVRTIFLDNDQAAVDPNGSPNPFLTDCLFYQNKHGIVPNCCGTPHASMSQVSFIHNQVPIYCKSKLPEMEQVNLINTTEWTIVYAGNESAEATGSIYWDDIDTALIRQKLFDAHQNSGGGVVHVRRFAKEPHMHDLLVQLLKEKPTSLLQDLELYLGYPDWEELASSSSTKRERTQFDFSKLREWETEINDVVLETQADETTQMEGVKDSDNVIVEVPKDVADGSVNDQQSSSGSSNHDTGTGTSESVENSKEEQRHGPYDTVSKNKTALGRFEIHVEDDDQWILFMSLALNLCFVWVISVVAFDCCCKKRVRSFLLKQVVVDEDSNEEEGLLDGVDEDEDEAEEEEEEEGLKTF